MFIQWIQRYPNLYNLLHISHLTPVPVAIPFYLSTYIISFGHLLTGTGKHFSSRQAIPSSTSTTGYSIFNIHLAVPHRPTRIPVSSHCLNAFKGTPISITLFIFPKSIPVSVAIPFYFLTSNN